MQQLVPSAPKGATRKSTATVIFASLACWAVLLAMIWLFNLLCTRINDQFLTRLGQHDPKTAHLSSVPGRLSDMMILGGECVSNTRQIALAHSICVLESVLAIAMVVVWQGGGWSAPTEVVQLLG